eukprot:CAMPEP_0168750642 /NCGR_PEP_ID=MMETSP0724-20121128/17386_1 /TAXON_ID=265536 /ORGANISM="Amphiprora sp., Strain CCMP467" /LENGTH=242 /DNA_ID=CAMNT_0008798687 /DNA_START=39 /DNA_END=764 /DNA_ORIENTATION=-
MSVDTAEDLLDLDLRLSRLEMQVLGVGPTDKLKTTKQPQNETKKAAVPFNKASRHRDSSIQDDNDQDEMDVLDTKSSTAATGDKDLASRLSSLEQTVAGAFSKSSHQRSVMDQLESHWKDITKYLNDLDPGTALTHQQQIAAPLLYRRQEVLASADELKQAMHQVAEILHLLLIGQQQPGKTKITEMHVTKAPIFVSTAQAVPTTVKQQINDVEETLLALQDRVDAAALKMDRLLTGYQQLV